MIGRLPLPRLTPKIKKSDHGNNFFFFFQNPHFGCFKSVFYLDFPLFFSPAQNIFFFHVSGEKKYSSRGPIDYSSGSFVVPMGTTEPPEEKWIDPRKPISCITVPEVQSSAKPRKSPQKANETIIR